MKVGDKVYWQTAPDSLKLTPFKIMAIEGDMARLDYVQELVPLSELGFTPSDDRDDSQPN